MTENKTAILRRIRALAAKTVDNGCTEEEAFSAAALLARLVDKYGFSPSDINEPAEKLTEAKIRSTANARAKEWFAMAVAVYCDCEVLMRRLDTNNRELVFFGMETDVLMCEYIMAILDRANETGFKAFLMQEKLNAPYGAKKTPKDIYHDRKAFDAGMANRVNARLKEMKNSRNSTVDESTGQTGGALVIVKNAVVSEAFAEKYKLRHRKSSTKINHRGNAYASGQRQGDSVAINRGVGGSSQLRLS
jgi:alkylhydroperoxidase/carboxymuconolactone decarboxylase family protein YurZ